MPSYELSWTRTPQAATGASTPSSSKTRRPLHNRAQPCSQWSATTAAARASWLSALGQVVSWLHVMAITSTHSALLPLQRHRLARGDDGYADQVSGRSLLFRSSPAPPLGGGASAGAVDSGSGSCPPPPVTCGVSGSCWSFALVD